MRLHSATEERPATSNQPAPGAVSEPRRAPAAVSLPLYVRVLRLRYLRPNGWQRALFVEGAIALAAVVVLADLASAWLIPVFPIAVAVVVKFHDLIVGALKIPPGERRR
jgi:hypothetical protein